ncbi:MAG: GNAT family N-acetyltransferase [Pseudomonadota bacterium]
MMRHDAPDIGILKTLDHPIWAALTTRQAHLGMGIGMARMYRAETAHFGTMGPAGVEDPAGLAALIADYPEGVVFMQADPILTSAGFDIVDATSGVQMMPTRKIDTMMSSGICDLTAADVPEMMDLVTLTQPGPFRRETHLMGGYFGVKSKGRLVAMAGERMKFPGFTEISAVCVHPDYRGRGIARALTSHVAARISARGEVPFLHAFASNAPAIALYESLGLAVRCMMHIARLVPAER